jgi:hypothetical protein
MTRQMGLIALVGLGIILSAVVQAQDAKVRVEGQVDSVRLEVRDASVREVLEVLSTSFGLRVHGSAVLEQPVSGIYRGSLQQVMARLLTGRDYVTTYSNGNVEISISGPGTDGKSQALAGRSAPPIAVPKRAAPAPASVIDSLTPTVVSRDAAPAAASTEKRPVPMLAPTAPPSEDKALRLFAPR